MTECNAIIEANNEIDKLKRENKKLNELCVEYGFEMGRLEEENENIKKVISNKRNEVIDDYEKSAKAGMPTGGLVAKINLLETIMNELSW